MLSEGNSRRKKIEATATQNAGENTWRAFKHGKTGQRLCRCKGLNTTIEERTQKNGTRRRTSMHVYNITLTGSCAPLW